MHEQPNAPQLGETHPAWVDLLPSVPTGEVNNAVILKMKDGTEHEAVLQFFEEISAPVLETRIGWGLEGAGWVRDGEYWLHRDGYVLQLSVDEPRRDKVLVMFMRMDT
jgi:hypothetical protein